jgi:hypothetical protein
MAKQIVVFDSQKLNAIQKCMRFYRYNMEQAFRPITTPDYFERGDLLHKMLQHYYTLRKSRCNWEKNHQSHADVVNACIKIGRHYSFKMQIDIAEVENVIDTFQQYTTFTANDNWYDVVAVEQVGSKVLYEDDDLIILYEFKIDLIINLMNVPAMPIDHKSVSQRRETEMLSNQFIGYCWALGVNNIIVNKIGFQKTLKPPQKFERQTLSYPKSIIDEWIANSVWWIKHAMKLSAENYYPTDYTSCDKYSGCLFREICRSDISTREYKLRSLFERSEKWDVGKTL